MTPTHAHQQVFFPVLHRCTVLHCTLNCTLNGTVLYKFVLYCTENPQLSRDLKHYTGLDVAVSPGPHKRQRSSAPVLYLKPTQNGSTYLLEFSTQPIKRPFLVRFELLYRRAARAQLEKAVLSLVSLSPVSVFTKPFGPDRSAFFTLKRVSFRMLHPVHTAQTQFSTP